MKFEDDNFRMMDMIPSRHAFDNPEPSYYVKICSHCKNIADWNEKDYGYYKCKKCKKSTILIVGKREFHERSTTSTLTEKHD